MDKMQFDKHTSTQFNAELEEARKNLMQMGGLVEQQVEDAIKALMDMDTALAQRVIETDQTVNSMEIDIDEECTRILARRHPAASDLRFVIAVTKAVNDLERIGDEASKVASHTLELADTGSGPQGYVELRHIGEQVRLMVQHSLDAFARLDADSALNVLHQDKAVDLEYGTAIRSLITTMMEDPRSISRALNVMWSLRSMERIGDHARNVAESVIFLVQGKDVRHKALEQVAAQVKKG
ncbi:phosphate transport system regulatory protein PhoU [Saccharospirillum sp. MSK14-1]|uniref:phosphate signaling complex protein PhoU n=1 Tax=Saccharospirillum sp. MSK14-1 TaxID=1897632 RepID=UPI000D38E238|nr:phosphate signaling complex protein PhoU [Saccharospirillum sp. MSK14-1]PTY35685.1 phosphate transport system regulatory protein PhoU [Saccharospirillum sp. MSK14-1]